MNCENGHIPTAVQGLSGLLAHALLREARVRRRDRLFLMGNGFERDSLDEPWQFALSVAGQTPFVQAGFASSKRIARSLLVHDDHAQIDRLSLHLVSLRRSDPQLGESWVAVDFSVATSFWNEFLNEAASRVPTAIIRTDSFCRWNAVDREEYEVPLLLLHPDDFFGVDSVALLERDELRRRQIAYARGRASVDVFAKALVDYLERPAFTPRLPIRPTLETPEESGDSAWTADALETEDHFDRSARKACYKLLLKRRRVLKTRRCLEEQIRLEQKTNAPEAFWEAWTAERETEKRRAVATGCRKLTDFYLPIKNKH